MSPTNHLCLQNEPWACPGTDHRTGRVFTDASQLCLLTDPDYVFDMVEDNSKPLHRPDSPFSKVYYLPACQNLEAFVFSRKISKNGAYRGAGDYCLKSLDDMENIEYNIPDDPMTRAVLQTIPLYRDRLLILEAEAPFSVLSALMDPMDLYLCLQDHPDQLITILRRIAHASALYLKACVEAGVRLISLADPAGTLNLVGPDYYRKFSGKAAGLLMKECEPFLGSACMHLCPKLSRSLLMTGMVRIRPEKASEDKIHPGKQPGDMEDFADYFQSLILTGDQQGIHFTGGTCIHGNGSGVMEAYEII